MANYVYASDTMTSVRRAVLENLKNHRGERNIVIVPDQFSLTIEREVLDVLKSDCCFDIEVVSFSRYADKVIGRHRNVLNKQTSVMLLSRVIIECADELLYYGKAAFHKGFAEEIYAVITNFRNCGVTVSKLENAANEMHGFMRNKLSDILLMYRGYIESLREYRDMTTMLELLRDKLSNDNEVAGTNYFITDFYDMSQAKYDIVKVLAQRAKNVYIGLLNNRGRNSHIYNKKFYNTIFSYADIEEKDIINIKSVLSDEKTLIKENIFAYGISCLKLGSESVEICEARNIESEIEYAAMRIRREIIADNARYRDIAVAVPDVNEYSEAIKRIFERYEIPLFIDKKYPLAEHTCFKILKLAVAAASLKQQDVINLIKDKSFGLTDDEQHYFENYLLKNNINGDCFLKFFNDAACEKIRLKIVDIVGIVNDCHCSIKNDYKITAGNFVENIKRFYNYININGILQLLDTASDELQRAINAQVMEKISDVIKDMQELFEDTVAPINVYYDILFNGLSSVKFSTVPLYLDCVFVGDSSDSRFGDMHTLYIIGANEGAYPKTSSGNGIIRDTDCEILARHGVELQSALDRNNSNKAGLLQLLLKPNKLIIISKSSGYDSLLKLQLQALLMIKPVKVSPRVSDNLKTADDIAFAAATDNNLELSMASGELVYDNYINKMHYIQENEIYASNVCDIAFYKNHISASGIEKFYTCPYMFYCEKVLRIKEREIAGEKANDIGTLMHEVLEKFYREKFYEREDIETAVRIIINECFKDERYSVLMNSGGRAIRSAMTRRAVKIVKSIDFNRKNSEFTPRYFEYEFGEGKLNAGLDIIVGGKKYNIGGFIDRIDIYEDNIAVFDYKSSKKAIEEKCIERGYMLQLPLYTNIAARNLSKLPVAMLYLTMPGKYVKENLDASTAICSGFLIDDDAITIKLDKNDLSSDGGFLPPHNKYDKSGLIKGKKFRIMSDDFIKFGNMAVDMIKQAVKLCETQELNPTPIKDACDYCKYINICRRAGDPAIVREK